jgi:hypothetical protein
MTDEPTADSVRSGYYSEPPEGVLRGESVPVENQEIEMADAELDAAVAALKERPAYHGRSDDELREIAKEKFDNE